MKPSLESMMLRASVGSMEHHRPTCLGCRRTPLVGEYLHRLGSGELLCGLCLTRVPDGDRAGVTSERVHAGERSLPVHPRAA